MLLLWLFQEVTIRILRSSAARPPPPPYRTLLGASAFNRLRVLEVFWKGTVFEAEGTSS